jgi:exosome complex component RRP45
VVRQTEQEVILSRILEKAIRRSNALDTESLCIIAGQQCWNIRADVHVVDYDGGLTDASCIAVIAALRHFRRPDVSIEGESVTIHTLAERVPVPLSLLHYPICVTFSFFHGGETVLIDATLQEEQLRESELVVTLNRHGEVCQIAKLGGAPVDALTLLQCTNDALVKVQEISKYITSRLEEDQTRKNIGGLIAELSAEHER